MKHCNVNYFCKAQHQKHGQLIPWESTSKSVLQTSLFLEVEIPGPFTCLYLPFYFYLLLCSPAPLFQPSVMLKSFCDGSDD